MQRFSTWSATKFDSCVCCLRNAGKAAHSCKHLNCVVCVCVVGQLRLQSKDLRKQNKKIFRNIFGFYLLSWIGSDVHMLSFTSTFQNTNVCVETVRMMVS